MIDRGRLVLGVGAAALLVAGTVPALASGGASRTGGTSSASCNDGTVTASPAVIWPPNHKMVPVTLAYAENDGAGDGDNDNISLSNITVTEFDANNPANTEGNGSGAPVSVQGPDSSVPSTLPAAVPDTQTWSVPIGIRAERAGTDGNGSGRVYQITVQCNDSGGTPDAADPGESLPTGQSGMATVAVCVPHDQSAASRAYCTAATAG